MPNKLSTIAAIIAFASAGFYTNSPAQTAFSADRLLYDIGLMVEAQNTFGSEHSPLWLNANKQGLSSVKAGNGYLRLQAVKPAAADSTHRWRMGFGADVAATYNHTAPLLVRQLYAEVEYRALRLTVGSRDNRLNLKNDLLSSGGQTYGINALPLPGITLELPEYLRLDRGGFIGIRGHVGFSRFTDGAWQQNYVDEGRAYAKGVNLHTKSGFLRIGNEARFPLVFEAGLETATQFGGTAYNLLDTPGETLALGSSFTDIMHAITMTGSDATDSEYANATGNTLGSWLFSLSYTFPTWKVRAYYDHFFEDHSMLFFQYGWKDGMIGLEVTLPRNRFVDNVVCEYINTEYQSGPVYHDHTPQIPDQISGIDNYYNHALYGGWQHRGQAIGNPLTRSFLYAGAPHRIYFTGNRFKAHHIGISGRPTPTIAYRLLYTHTRGLGTYALPYAEALRQHSILAEINFAPHTLCGIDTRGWSGTAAIGIDSGKLTGNNSGLQITLRRHFTIAK